MVVPLVQLPGWLRVVLDVGAWAAWSVLVGWIGHRRAASDFAVDRWWSRLRRREAGGRWYERRLRVKAWKDRLPEAGALFAGGTSKRSLPAGADRRSNLQRFVVETRRAEWVHWVVAALVVVFPVWNDPWVLAPMVVYAAAANGPCIAVQRYNRARALSALGTGSGRPAKDLLA
jgi:glycosyl-4,4'-diaponeurosporenoate acyltransferase